MEFTTVMSSGQLVTMNETEELKKLETLRIETDDRRSMDLVQNKM